MADDQGMDSRLRGNDGWGGRGGYFRGILHAALGLHTSDENVCGAKAGNHKGCPYNGFVGVYFHTNR